MALPLLKGVRIIELALLMPADHVGGMLADMGAEVVKVEQPSSPVEDGTGPPIVGLSALN